MYKHIISAIVSAVVTSLVFVFFVLPTVRSNYRSVGYNDGQISARTEIAAKIERALGSGFDRTEIHERLFEVKTTEVVVVHRNGVKTLRTNGN